MKFIEKIFVIFCFATIILIGTVFAESGTVNVSATRLRKENNTDSDIITNIYEDDKVEILGEAGDWYQVKYDENIGYVKKQYITVDKTSNNTTNTSSNNVVSNSTTNNTVQNTAINNEAPVEQPTDSSIVTTNSVSVLRNLPSMISSQIAQIEQSKQLTKITEIGNWAQVTDGNITGWISKSKIINSIAVTEPINSSNFTSDNTVNESQVENTTNTATNNTVENNTTNTISNETTVDKTGVINVETAKVRESANSTATVVEFLDYNDKVTIVAEDGEWYKITSSKASGYVSKRLITLVEDGQKLSSRSLEESRTGEDDTVVSNQQNDELSQVLNNSNDGNQVSEYAKQYLGYSYVTGGKTPTSGFDCSGFTRYVYSNFGYSLGSTAASQTDAGTEVTREDMQVGDLILFYNEGKTSIGHTGIYLGNGEFIHSANPQRGVVTDNLNTNSYYNERFVSARRIVK